MERVGGAVKKKVKPNVYHKGLLKMSNVLENKFI